MPQTSPSLHAVPDSPWKDPSPLCCGSCCCLDLRLGDISACLQRPDPGIGVLFQAAVTWKWGWGNASACFRRLDLGVGGLFQASATWISRPGAAKRAKDLDLHRVCIEGLVHFIISISYSSGIYNKSPKRKTLTLLLTGYFKPGMRKLIPQEILNYLVTRHVVNPHYDDLRYPESSQTFLPCKIVLFCFPFRSFMLNVLGMKWWKSSKVPIL